VTGIAAVATFMLKKSCPKVRPRRQQGFDLSRAAAGPAPCGTTDGGRRCGPIELGERFAALDQGMKEILYLGKEVKNSWGTWPPTTNSSKRNPS